VQLIAFLQVLALAAPASARATPENDFRIQQIAAAEEHERLWYQTKDPRELARAAQARISVEEYGHAIDLYRQLFLLKQLDPALARAARNGMLEARSHTIPVVLSVDPVDLPPGATLTLRNGSQAGGRWDMKTPIESLRLRSAGPRSYRFELEPGAWSLSVSAPGFRDGWVEVFVSLGQVPAQAEMTMVPDMGTVEMTFTPADAEVSLKVLEGPGLERPSSQRVTTGRLRQKLRVGKWVVEAQASGYRPVRQEFNVRAERSLETSFVMVPTAVGEQATGVDERLEAGGFDRLVRDRKILAGTLGGLGGLSLATGIGLWVGGFNRQVSARWLNQQAASLAGIPDFEAFTPTTDGDFKRVDYLEQQYSRQTYISDMGQGLASETAGGALVGAGLGFALTSMTGIWAPTGRKGKRIWVTELGVGGALTLAGGLWLGVVSMRYNRNLGEATRTSNYQLWRPSEATLQPLRINQLASSIVLGVGVGTLIGSSVGYFVWKRPREPYAAHARVGTYADATGGGLTLHGRF